MKPYYLFCLCFFLILPGASAQNWHSPNPTPSQRLSRDIHFVDSLNGFFLALDGLYRTTDGGMNWASYSIRNEYSYAMAFRDNLGVITGAHKFWISTDYGETWIQYNIQGRYSMISIWNYDAIYLGADSRLAVTNFDNSRWEVITYYNNQPRLYDDVRDIHFTSENIGFAVTDDSKIIRTSNAGMSWQLQYQDSTSSGKGKKIAFYGSIGLMANSLGEVYKSDDEGDTWSLVQSSVFLSIQTIFFLNSHNIYLGGDDGLVLLSTDGGDSWTDISSSHAIDLYAIHFWNASTGIAVGEFGHIQSTDNHGLSWQIRSIIEDLWDIEFFTEDVGFALGSHLYRTIDGGENWTMVNQNSTFTSSNKCFFPDENNGYISQGRHLLKTTDRGVYWELLPQLTPTFSQTIENLFFVNDMVGFISGSAGGASPFLSRTIDGGLTWTQQSSVAIEDMYFFSPEIGFTIQNGGLYRTTNGGLDWISVLEVASGTFTSMDFVDNVGIIVGEDGLIYRSFDQGDNWNRILSNFNDDFEKVVWDTNQLGLILRQFGKILLTLDGGNFWEEISIPFLSIWQNDIFIIPNHKVFVCGNYGTIFFRRLPNLYTATDTLFLKSPISIYPNPSGGWVQYDLGILEGKLKRIIIQDIEGSIMKEFRTPQNSIDVSFLPQGVWILGFEIGEQIYYHRLIRE